MENMHSYCRTSPADMRILQIVIFTLIAVHPNDVLSKGSKRTKGPKEPGLGPCGKKFLRQINGKCYYFAGKKLNWFGAQNNCLRKNLNLADLASEQEYNAVLKFLKSRGNMEDYWFGGNDLQAEGRFTYISTGRPVRYLGGIDAIESTHRSNLDDCLEVRLRENTTTVTDDNCMEQQYFVCQQNEVKCAQPSADEKDDQKHSHEHLHHFHHNAAKNEADNSEKGSNEESVESDSRPADDTNSTEVGESSENTATNDDRALGQTLKENEKDGTEGSAGKATNATEAVAGAVSPATPAVEENATPAATGETAEPAVTGRTAEPAETGETAAPAVTEETAAPAETEETAAPAVTEETAAPAVTEETAAPAETGETAAPAGTGEAAEPGGMGEAVPPAGVGEAAEPGGMGEALPPAELGEAVPPAGTGEGAEPGGMGEAVPPAGTGEGAEPGGMGEAAPAEGDKPAGRAPVALDEHADEEEDAEKPAGRTTPKAQTEHLDIDHSTPAIQLGNLPQEA